MAGLQGEDGGGWRTVKEVKEEELLSLDFDCGSTEKDESLPRPGCHALGAPQSGCPVGPGRTGNVVHGRFAREPGRCIFGVRSGSLFPFSLSPGIRF